MKAVQHRHSLGHEHEFEPQHGLPEALPADERVLWQGSPDWRALAIHAFHARKLAWYFSALLVLRALFVIGDGGGPAQVVASLAWLLPMAVLAIAAMVWLARLQARATAYTITDKRVILRIGIVLTVTFNLPFQRIHSAGLKLRAGGIGDISLRLQRGERIALLHLWPHVRPWQMAQPEPMLRCVPDAAEAARVLATAWSAATGTSAPALANGAPRAMPIATPVPAGMPTPSQRPGASAARWAAGNAHGSVA